jgi:hypothetical protein
MALNWLLVRVMSSHKNAERRSTAGKATLSTSPFGRPWSLAQLHQRSSKLQARLKPSMGQKTNLHLFLGSGSSTVSLPYLPCAIAALPTAQTGQVIRRAISVVRHWAPHPRAVDDAVSATRNIRDGEYGVIAWDLETSNIPTTLV